MTASHKKSTKAQPDGMVFALDIGTRSIIGIVGVVEGEKLRVIAMEQEEHAKRSMIDGQIEDIEQVAEVARNVKKRLEEQLDCTLKQVCVAAAGRALKTQRASFEMKLPKPQKLDHEIISRLEAGAICEAETAFNSGQDAEGSRQFYLVGHTTVQYYMDGYPTSSLLDHQARAIRAEVIATFLPREVVESLYTAMHRVGLEVSSLTLEPIAAINAVIPKNLWLLNLALVDVGAGTSDIAVSRDGSVVGYTMVTVAGDEITEVLMKKYLLDFNTAELIKIQLGSQDTVQITDILGIRQTISKEDMAGCIKESQESLCREIAEHICEVNGGPPAAVFLAGGGSKLEGMQACVAKYLNIDVNRVAIAGNNFKTYAVSDACDLGSPEYATPLGIAISAGLNLITENFHVTLNGNRAKLFSNGKMTVLDILMMNGFSYRDLIPQTGQKLIIELNGKRSVFYGSPGEPAALRLNGLEAKFSDFVHAGDSIEFSPASLGKSARRFLKDIIEPGQAATVNGITASPETLLKNGDEVIAEEEPALAEETQSDEETPALAEAPSAALIITVEPVPVSQSSAEYPAKPSLPPAAPVPVAPESGPAEGGLELILNNSPILLTKKTDGSPYYLMDLLERSGIDLENPTGTLVLRVNGKDGSFLQELKHGDRLEIMFQS